jgi:hypothetical protein
MMRLRLTGTSGLGYELALAETLFGLGARPPVVCAVCHIGKKNSNTAVQDHTPAFTQAGHAALRSLLDCSFFRT